MVLKDGNFFTYLEAAFRYKLYTNGNATSFNYLGYNLPYKSIGGVKGVFEYARKILPPLYTKDFENTEEGNLKMAKKLLEKLDNRQDLNLQRFFNQATVTAEHGALITEAASQQATEESIGESPASMTDMPSSPFNPSAFSGSSNIRIVRNTPHAPEETPKLVTANKSGVVIGEESPPSTIVTTNKSGVITGEHQINPQTNAPKAPEPEKPKLVAATKSGAIIEEPPSKIFLAGKSGQIINEHPITPHVARGRFNFSALKASFSSSSLVNAFKNVTSRAGIFFQRNFGKFFTIGNIGTAVSGGLGGIIGHGLGGGNPFAAGAGALGGVGTRYWITGGGAGPALSRIGNGAINAGVRLSNAISGPKLSSLKKSTGKRVFIAFGLFLVLFGTVAATIPSQDPSSSQTNNTNPTTGSAATAAIPVVASSCPIPNGQVTCGTKSTPINGCGHCGLGYEQYMSYCVYKGTESAIDIAGSDFQEVKLPEIKGHIIKWEFKQEEPGSTQAIQVYTGKDEQTQEGYWLQLHHTQAGSGNPGTHFSGEKAANICGGGCNEGHVHVQLGGDVGTAGITWHDAALYLCR